VSWLFSLQWLKNWLYFNEKMAMDEIYLGLMSGTSLDAVDVVAVSFEPTLRLLGTHSLLLPVDIREDVLALTQTYDNEIERLGRIDVLLGRLFADCANQLLEKLNLSPSHITAIGSHGQTIRHRPDLEIPFTLQITDPNVIAEQTKITVVADFRRRDVAAGGQGAPLVPAFHAAILRDNTINRVILNLGGMANITVLPADSTLAVYGYDTGPANVLMDAWCQTILKQPFDKNGTWAASGRVDNELLANMLAHPFFAKSPPKSTGREDFHLDWLLKFFEGKYTNILEENTQATLLALTAQSVVDAVNQTGFATGELWLCGGGAYNQQLWQTLAKQLPSYTLHTTSEVGIAPTWVEATAFAWLAYRTIHHLSGNLPAVTGAHGERILGAIYQA
jgi:anhydro-N-acetylmuramic acid kinase